MAAAAVDEEPAPVPGCCTQAHAGAGAVMIDIDAELACWQRLEDASASQLVFLFHEWEPAIRVGVHAYLAYPDRDFDSIEPIMIAAYQRIRGRSRIPWSRAAPAARRVWQKLCSDSASERDGQRLPVVGQPIWLVETAG